MPILTANINFLASLGITTSEQFTAAFGDMADFTEYCTAIGYSWELDENNDIILITPNGNKVNTYVPALTGPTSIQFDSESYSISGVEYDPSLKENFTITDNLGNYVDPSNCTFTLYPNNTGLNISIGRTNCFDATEMTAGSYTITVTATYEGMTATTTVNADIAAPVPQSISFDSNTYTITANEGESNPTPFVVEDDLGNDVTVSCTYTFSPNNTGIFVDDMGATDRAFNTQYMTAGAYTVTVTATYEGLTATATLDISIDAPVAEDIYFDSDSYSLTGTVGDPGLQQSFSVTDDLGNDVTSDCTITLYPNNTGISVTGGLIDATSMSEGVYHITMTASYEGLTATSTIDVDIAAPIPQSISFDSNSYSISGAEGDLSLIQPFTVEDDLGNDVTMDCSFECNPDDGLNVSNGEFDAMLMPEGTYSTTVTATYGELTATATVDIDITAPVLSSIEFDRSTYTLTAEEGESPMYAFAVYDNLGNDVTSDCNYYLSPDNTGLWVEAPGVFHLNEMTIGTYSVEMTAEYIDGSDTYTASATVDIEITAPAQIPDYLKLDILQSPRLDDDITITIPASVTPTQATSLSYSYDGIDWYDTVVDSTDQTITIPVSVGDEVYLKGIAKQWSTGSNSTKINSTRMNFAVSGNVMSLFYGDNFENQTSFPANSMYNLNELFKDNTHLIDASQLELPATTLAQHCYSNMFDGCTSLTSAPDLPATTLVRECYGYMFKNCTSLTTAPDLPATTLPSATILNWGCYEGMFDGCTSLTSAPDLPATTLTNNCYRYMFRWCTSLTSAPDLPATTLVRECYNSMFYGCKSLTSAPDLPATTLAQSCYQKMFSVCTSLTSVPSNYLPATTLADSCYQEMFSGCKSLTSAPDLPATTLTNNCYRYMFSGCKSLTSAPALPATTLANSCYSYMFLDCTSLTTAPKLPATTLAGGCYSSMFEGCSSLNNITMLAEDISATNCLNNWVQNVAATGTFTKSANMTTLPTGDSGIPTGWTVVDYTP